MVLAFFFFNNLVGRCFVALQKVAQFLLHKILLFKSYRVEVQAKEFRKKKPDDLL